MPKVVAHDVLKSSKSALKYSIYVLHGENDELKAELFTEIRNALGVTLDDPFRLARLSGEDLDSDQGRLADELGAISMFGGSRLIHVTASARVGMRAAEQGLAIIQGDVCLVVVSPDISDADGFAELAADRRVAAIACGEEGAGNLHAFVTAEFAKAQLACDQPAIEALILLVGGERAAIRGEIEKLAALLGPGGRVDMDHIREVVADASTMVADSVAAAAMAGESGELARLLDRLEIAGSDPVQALGAAHRLVLNMHRAKVRQWGGRNDARGPAWSAAETRGLVRSLGAAVLQCRSDGPNAALLAERTLVVLGNAARLKRR